MTTQQRIKEAALGLFSLQGYSGTSVGEIAKKVSIKTPSIYAHFSSKEEIFITLVDEVLSNYMNYMKDAITKSKGKSRKERLFDYFRDFVHYFSLNHAQADFMKMILIFPPVSFVEIIKNKVSNIERTLIPYLVNVFRDTQESNGFKQEDIDMVTAYFSFISGYVIGIVKLSPELNQNRLKQVWNVFWEGLKKQVEAGY